MLQHPPHPSPRVAFVALTSPTCSCSSALVFSYFTARWEGSCDRKPEPFVMISWQEVRERTRDSVRPRPMFLRRSQLARSLHRGPSEGSPLLCSIVSLSVSRCDLGVKPGFAVPCRAVPSHRQGFCSLHSCSSGLDWCSLSLPFCLFFFASSLYANVPL